ncbi:MAG: phosphatase PAP2 family protein [bacterium]|nr:phosphatase PAP2 family protein [bacterium]
MTKTIKDRLAFMISAVFSPPLVAGLAILAISVYYESRYEYFWIWALLGIFILIGPASAYVYWAFHKGNVRGLNLSEREERLRPLAIALIGAVIGTWVLLRKDAPAALTIMGITLISELVIIIFVTVFWKISLHTMAFSSVVTLLAYLYNPYALILYFFLIPVGWSRIHRKRHSLLQVIAGSLVGLITALGVFTLFHYRSR